MTDDLALLTGPSVGNLLAAALGEASGRLVGWAATRISHDPGGGTTVSYRAQVERAEGVRPMWIGASTRRPPGGNRRPGLLTIEHGDRQVLVWCWPDDPWLPALPTAVDAESAERLLGRFAGSTGPVRVRVRAYRPGRRAVLELTGRHAKAFVKVLRPGRVGPLHERHVVLSHAGFPVPRSLGHDDGTGLLVLTALPGTPMRQRLREQARMPSGAALLDLLDRLPAETLHLPRRASWTDGVQHYAEVVAATVPAHGGRARDLAAAVVDGLSQLSTDPEPTHGDFHEAHLLLDGDTVTGVLDVDTAGPGRRADDLACLIAHLEVLAEMEPGHRATTRALAAAYRTDFERRVDPVELRLRTAGVLLSLATGPHRAQEPGWAEATSRRLDLVADEVQRAGIASAAAVS